MPPAPSKNIIKISELNAVVIELFDQLRDNFQWIILIWQIHRYFVGYLAKH